MTALEHVTEERPTLWERFADTTRRYRAFVEAIIWEMAARDDLVVAGRGAWRVLAGVNHALRVRITASEPVRVARVERRLGVGRDAAVDLVRQNDRERASRVRFLYHVDWDDPLLYDIVLTTDRMDEPLALRLLRSALEDARWHPTPESRRVVVDEALAAQARAVLVADPVTQPLQLAVGARNGQVWIRGVAPRADQRRAAEEVVRRLAGVTAVANEIVVTAPPRNLVGV